MKLAGCFELGQLDIAGNVCTWQWGASAMEVAESQERLWCVLDNGTRLPPDVTGFVSAMFPQGGYTTRGCLHPDTCALHGPNCSESPIASVGPGEWTPWEWLMPYVRHDLLLAHDEAFVQYHASIGNGFLATDMDAASLYLAGVFNGPDAAHEGKEGVSHRAAVPNPLLVAPAAPFRGNAGAALDLRHAVYTRRSRLPPTRTQPTAILEQRFYAHRTRSSLLVMEMEVHAESDDLVSVELHPNGAPAPADFDAKTAEAQIVVNGYPIPVHIWTGETLVTEEGVRPIEVTVAVPAVVTGVWTLTLQRGQQAATAAAFRSSIETNDTRQAALDDLQAALVELQKDLMSEGGASRGAVRRAHEDAWEALWQGGFEVSGRPDVARAANSSLYYILSSLREDRPFSLSPGGLASNAYNGHTFWDTETWMYPPLLAWHPPLARSLLRYREARLHSARAKALSSSPRYRGAMFAWESAASGHETCPTWAPFGKLEQHISADIVVAARDYFYMTRDVAWLRESGYELVASVADFYASLATPDSGGRLHIKGVIPPDEYADGGVTDSVYTNAAAKEALSFAVEAAAILGLSPGREWARVADSLVLPLDEATRVHPEYAGYKWGTKIKQADAVLLPHVLRTRMDRDVQANDLEYYAKVTDPAGPAMTWGVHAIDYLRLGDRANAAANFNRSFANTKWPFGVWTETPTGGVTNFITGAGGFLQALVFGYCGVEIGSDHLEIRPVLPEGASRIRLRGLRYLGRSLTIHHNRISTTLTLEAGPPLAARSQGGAVLHFSTRMEFPAGQPIRVTAPPDNVDITFGHERRVLWTWILVACGGAVLAVFALVFALVYLFWRPRHPPMEAKYGGVGELGVPTLVDYSIQFSV